MERPHSSFLDVWFPKKGVERLLKSPYRNLSEIVGVLPLHQNGQMRALSQTRAHSSLFFPIDTNQKKRNDSAIFYFVTKQKIE